jgi:hypothetical protein
MYKPMGTQVFSTPQIDHLLVEKQIDETKSVFVSPKFLSGCSPFNSLRTEGPLHPLSCKECSLEEYDVEDFETMDGNKRTPFTILNHNVYKLRSAFGIVHAYFSPEFDKSLSLARESITNITDASLNLVNFCNDITKHLNSLSIKNDIFYSNQATISLHIDAIVKMRVLTMSKREGITEILLQAYSVGYFPFGWDLRTYELYVLNPYHYIDYTTPKPLKNWK